MHVFAAWFSQNTVKISLNRSKWYKVGKSVNVSSSGIGIDVLQMTQLISCWRCLLALAAVLSRHIRQNECKQGKVLGSWSVPKQYRHLVVTSRSFKHHHEAIDVSWLLRVQTSRDDRMFYVILCTSLVTRFVGDLSYAISLNSEWLCNNQNWF